MVTWSQSSHVVNAQKTLATMRQEPSSTMSGPLLNLGDSQDRKLAPFLRKNLVVVLKTKWLFCCFVHEVAGALLVTVVGVTRGLPSSL